MKRSFTIFLGLFILFSSLLLTKDNWPALFSRQGTIDPLTLAENFDPAPPLAVYNNQPLNAPAIMPSIDYASVLGDTDPKVEKRIEVDLTRQRTYAFEGDKLVHDFIISSGKWDRTPTGTFYIWTKISSQKMSGGSKELGTYYYLPNVPYIMFFYNDKVAKHIGYSFHGTYWHENFGTPQSHGCINMKTPEAKILFEWADPKLNGKTSQAATADNPGTKVIIYGKYNPNISTSESSILLPDAALKPNSILII